jgi:DNA-binding NarL/FixJ family response regulator
MIRACLIEDQNLVSEGLESLIHLTPDIRVIALARDGSEALEIVEKLNLDILLLDLRMPGMDGLAFLKQLNEKNPSPPPTIILTTFDDDASVLEGLRLGAKGYLLKDVSFSKLTDAIRTVATGGTLISPVITERLLRGFQALPSFPGVRMIEGLTEREVEILRLMTGGFSNREIASALGIVEGTVKNHVSNILGKLGARDRIRAVLKAIELGYV